MADLGAGARGDGFAVVHRPSVGSTNVEALSLAGADRVWVVADEQVSGRGSRGRNWVSPRGNLYASLRLVAPSSPPQAAQLCFVAALALADAIAAEAPNSAALLRLKWPNDALVDGAKVAGILIEGSHGPDGFVSVIGMGANVTSHPDDTPYPSTALSRRDPGVTVARLFAALSDGMARRLREWAGGRGFSSIRSDWLAHAAGLGAPIVVRLPTGDLSGCFEALDEEGRLILAGQDGRHAISAGEVFLPAFSRPIGAP